MEMNRATKQRQRQCQPHTYNLAAAELETLQVVGRNARRGDDGARNVREKLHVDKEGVVGKGESRREGTRREEREGNEKKTFRTNFFNRGKFSCTWKDKQHTEEGREQDDSQPPHEEEEKTFGSL